MIGKYKFFKCPNCKNDVEWSGGYESLLGGRHELLLGDSNGQNEKTKNPEG